MRTLLVTAIFGLATLGLAAAPSEAHPPTADASQGCLAPTARAAAGAPEVLVDGTLSYLAPFPAFLSPLCLAVLPLPPPLPPLRDAWGSHAPACPAPPFTGPFVGNFCGAVVGAGATDTCAWQPDINSFETKLVVGFDTNGDGRITHPAESPLVGPLAAGAWTVTNPHAVAARLIAYPTNVDPLFLGATNIADANFVTC